MTARRPIRVLEIIEAIGLGGACRSLLAFAKYARLSREVSFGVVGLTPGDRRAVDLARDAGVEAFDACDARLLEQEMRRADIVQVHFWNNPAVYEFLRRPLPPVRLSVWCHIGGHHPPQVVPAALLDYADVFIAASPVTLELPVVDRFRSRCGEQRVALIPDSADLQRMVNVRQEPHEGYNVGYIGTVDFAKMHPDFVAMHDIPEIADLRVIVCGDGEARRALEGDVRRRGAADRFEFLGYRRDINPVIPRLDVFGYPLCRENYSAAELILQEVMSAGVPPVVLPYGGAGRLVDNGVDGIVARDPEDYRQALIRLRREPQLRRRLGEAARARAQREMGAQNQVTHLLELFDRLLTRPLAPRSGLRPGRGSGSSVSGACAFIDSLGPFARDFTVSHADANIDAVLAAEARIATSGPELASGAAGGIVHYRREYPEDPHLRLWSGLALETGGRNALALAEYHHAVKLGLDHWRVHGYLGRTAARLGATDLAGAARRRVAADAPRYLQRFFANH